MFKPLDEHTMIAGQITADQLVDARRLGVTHVVNNRPDGEEPGQPTSGEMEAACTAHGLAYRHVPIGYGIGPAEVGAMQEALQATGEGKLLAYCRSGTRSTLAWALARHSDGADPAELSRAAESAGFSLTPIAHLM
jgi:uncharacterized protein (TIGR01244 family)